MSSSDSWFLVGQFVFRFYVSHGTVHMWFLVTFQIICPRIDVIMRWTSIYSLLRLDYFIANEHVCSLSMSCDKWSQGMVVFLFIYLLWAWMVLIIASKAWLCWQLPSDPKLPVTTKSNTVIICTRLGIWKRPLETGFVCVCVCVCVGGGDIICKKTLLKVKLRIYPFIQYLFLISKC